jgi:hypothetical protein
MVEINTSEDWIFMDFTFPTKAAASVDPLAEGGASVSGASIVHIHSQTPTIILSHD